MFVRVYSWYAEIVWAEQLLRNLHDRLKLDVAEEDFCTFGLEFDAASGDREFFVTYFLAQAGQHERDLAICPSRVAHASEAAKSLLPTCIPAADDKPNSHSM